MNDSQCELLRIMQFTLQYLVDIKDQMKFINRELKITT